MRNAVQETCDLYAKFSNHLCIGYQAAGIASIEALEIAERGIINIMREFGLLEGLVFHNKQQVYIGEDVFIQSNFDGIIYTLVDCGQTITIGDLIGYTTDYFGNIVEEYRAPFTSIVLMNFVSPPVNKGDNIFWIAKKVDHLK